ncbi:MAG: biosynthetic-type acetolactate synthase large subunit [Bacteroidetes bacterium]|nr:MAG: biosynthetic-type acetolactate synthase large subunit [Bacteroidota bacterium]
MEAQTYEPIKKEQCKAVNITGAEAMMECLVQEGVELMFGYPGGAIMPVYDALYSYSDRLKHVLVRHEQGAIHAAQGFARVSGKVGVCLVTSGPAATNVVTGIADAMIDSTPVVIISGQVGSNLLGTDAFQETDVIGITQPVTKWNYQITRAEDIPWAMAKAFYVARSGRPGPVLIDITKDAQFNKFDFRYQKMQSIRSYQPVPQPDLTKINEASHLINLAKKPLALVGQGVVLANAEKELMEFLEKTGIPAAWTILGLSAMPTDHPLNVGMLGMHGNYGPNIKTNQADLIIGIGMRFDDRVTANTQRYATNARVIHMEIDPAEINKIIHADVPVLGTVKETLPLLTQKVNKNEHTQWLEEFNACYRVEHERLIGKELHPEKPELTMGEVVRRVSEAFDDDAIMVTDVGQHQMVATRYFKFRQSRSVVTSGGLGTMGFGLPAAIGAKLGAPERHVCLFVGDGGFQMTIQELGTIFQEKVPVKIILLNNNFLGMVRQWQELFFDFRYAQTELINPDFQTIAKGYYIPAIKVTERENLDDAIKTMAESEGPFLLEVVVEKEGNVFPMVPSGMSVDDIRLE